MRKLSVNLRQTELVLINTKTNISLLRLTFSDISLQAYLSLKQKLRIKHLKMYWLAFPIVSQI